MSDLTTEEKAAAVDRVRAIREADTARAVEEARHAVTAQVRAEEHARVAPKLVDPVLRSALAGHLTDDAVTAVLDPIDRTRFLDSDGAVDHDRVAAFAASFAATATPNAKTVGAAKRFPSLGQGRRGDAIARPGVETGRALYAGRHRRGGRR